MRSRDYEEFVESLNASGARYLIVGAHAVAFHARPRATKDFDRGVDPAGGAYTAGALSISTLTGGTPTIS